MILLFGIFLIIFRREAIIIWDEHKNNFKTKHPKIGRIFNPGIVALLIAGAASSAFWFLLLRILYANNVGDIWQIRLIKFLHAHGFNKIICLYAVNLPHALFTAVIFSIPFTLISHRRLFSSPVIFISSFLMTVFSCFSIYGVFKSFQKSQILMPFEMFVCSFAGFFILFAWLGARLTNRALQSH